jgi:hypothetical protein
VLPLSRLVLAACLLAAASCTRTQTLAIQAAMCGELCGDPKRAGTDFDGFECATAARIRLIPDDGSKPAETCVHFVDPGSGRPGSVGLHDLFATDENHRAAPVALPALDGMKPFWVEISLYASYSRPMCGDGAALVGVGQSRRVDPAREQGPVQVPLGCRKACEARDAVTLIARAFEDGAAMPMPTLDGFGEIFAYEALTGTAGVCEEPAPTKHHGEFRAFPVTIQGDRVTGSFTYDRSRFAGCVAARLSYPGIGNLYTCLGELTSKSTAGISVMAPERVARLVARNSGSFNGVLAIRVTENGAPAVGAQVFFDLFAGQNEADYAQDADYTVGKGSGTTVAGGGVAFYTNAPTGPHTVRFADGTMKRFNAGAAFDPIGVTTIVIEKNL